MKVLLVLMMFGWAGCTQQEEPKISTLRGNYTGVDSIYVPKPKFDPTKHYIISVDTVGWAETKTYYLDTTWWWQKNCCGDDSVRGFYADPVDIMVWQPTLDTNWADRKPLLLTPEELKKIKGLLNE